MSSVVTVTINGRSFRMGCDAGQEEHLTRLAEVVDEKINLFKGSYGEIGDTRLTVMASIMLADELNEATKQIKLLQAELDQSKETRTLLHQRYETLETDVVTTLNQASEEIARMAERLQRGAE